MIGILNVESRQRGAFNEDDRQFAEIFGRYIAMALNTLDLMVKERVETSHKIADEVSAEVAGPLNDIAFDARFDPVANMFSGTLRVTTQPGGPTAFAGNASGVISGLFFGPSANEVGGEEIGEPNHFAAFVQAREREHFLDHRGQVRGHRPHALENVQL